MAVRSLMTVGIPAETWLPLLPSNGATKGPTPSAVAPTVANTWPSFLRKLISFPFVKRSLNQQAPLLTVSGSPRSHPWQIVSSDGSARVFVALGIQSEKPGAKLDAILRFSSLET